MVLALENPGWSVKIDLEDIEDTKFEQVSYDAEYSDNWLTCVKDKVFVAYAFVPHFAFPVPHVNVALCVGHRRDSWYKPEYDIKKRRDE